MNFLKSLVKDGIKEGTEESVSKNVLPVVGKIAIGVGIFALGCVTGGHVTNAKWTRTLLMEVLKR